MQFNHKISEESTLQDILNSSKKRTNQKPSTIQPQNEKATLQLKSMLIPHESNIKESIKVDSKQQSVMALKSLLSKPAESIGSNEMSNEQKKESLQALKSILKSTSPPKVNEIRVSPKTSIKNSSRIKVDTQDISQNNSESSPLKFATSKLLTSPDPVAIPLPDFEENFFS